ncbi:MAG: hypothetical protein KDC98_25730 [Planctomycetes bacterium]|nr:hypothetical protein [Planctomycetota bacterium]
MRTRLPIHYTIAALTAAAAGAQSPLLTMTPAVSLSSPSATVRWSLTGPIALPHAIMAHINGGPQEYAGELILLGYQPSTLHFAMSSSGTTTGSFAVPPSPGLIGTIIYAQHLGLDPTAPNGTFRAGNGASAVIHAAPDALVLDFTDPVAQGFSGNFRDDIVGHIRGGPVQHRTQDTWSPRGYLFGAGIQSPLIPLGCREQMVFRAQDIGAIGEPELVTGVSWLSFGPAMVDTFLQFELRMGHTPVVPDYTVDIWSALPIAPNSGLSTLFANNEVPGEPPVTVALGRYDVDPTAGNWTSLGHFVPYPAITPFAYNGTTSLLLDFRVSQGLYGINGQTVQLMVQSSPMPAARAVAGGTWLQPLPLPNPGQATQANRADCAMPILQFEFARVETHAESPWLDSNHVTPDYQTAIVAASNAVGTSVQLRFRGSHFANGTGATPWSTTQDIADGMRFLQIDVRLIGNPISDAVPIVDTLVVPIL